MATDTRGPLPAGKGSKDIDAYRQLSRKVQLYAVVDKLRSIWLRNRKLPQSLVVSLIRARSWTESCLTPCLWRNDRQQPVPKPYAHFQMESAIFLFDP